MEEATNKFYEVAVPPEVMVIPSEEKELEEYMKGNLLLSLGIFAIALGVLVLLLLIFLILTIFK